MTGRTAIGIRRALAAGLAALTAGSGCGGGSKAISQEEYLTRAKEVCQKGSADLKSASDDVLKNIPAGQKLSEAQIDDFVRKTVVPTIRRQVKLLREIPAPKGEKGHVGEIYKALDRGLDTLEKEPKKLSDGSDVFADADSLSKKYGLGVCAAG